MNKARAVDFLGGREETADAMGCSTQAISNWPDPLPPRIQDRVIAAGVRQGKRIPRDLIAANRRAYQ